MKTAIVIGSSGLVGKQLLKQLVESQLYSKIISVVRKPSDRIDSKIEELLINFEEIEEELSNCHADSAFCCLGTTIKAAGSKANQFRVDHDYVVDFAKICSKNGITEFAVVSSIGANAESTNFYLRTKGLMENHLKQIPYKKLFILRPSMLLGKREEFRFGELIGKVLMKVLNPFFIGRLKKYRGIYAYHVALGMIRWINSEKEGQFVIESDQIIM